MSFAVITLFIVSQRVFIVVSIYFAMDSVRKLLDTLSYIPVMYISLYYETFLMKIMKLDFSFI
jgi:hypothetical protein